MLRWGKSKYSLKREGALNRLREDTVPGNSGDIKLCPNCWAAKGALLQSILNNWVICQKS